MCLSSYRKYGGSLACSFPPALLGGTWGCPVPPGGWMPELWLRSWCPHCSCCASIASKGAHVGQLTRVGLPSCRPKFCGIGPMVLSPSWLPEALKPKAVATLWDWSCLPCQRECSDDMSKAWQWGVWVDGESPEAGNSLHWCDWGTPAFSLPAPVPSRAWLGWAMFSEHLQPWTAALLWHCLFSGGFSELPFACLGPWE